MECIKCGKEIEEPHDYTESNYDSGRAKKGQHTGDIYWCDDCEINIIDDQLNGVVREWIY